jgi:hypothetical protein
VTIHLPAAAAARIPSGVKRIARGFQLANAAAKAVVKAASDGVKKIDQRAARGLGLTSAKDGDDGDGEETGRRDRFG